MKWACRLIPTAIIAFALLGPAEREQEQTEAPPQNPAQEQTQAQPNEVVARVSIVDGNVATERGGAGEWVATTVNAPVDRGDKVSTADKSRTEVQLDYANVLHLDARAGQVGDGHDAVWIVAKNVCGVAYASRRRLTGGRAVRAA